MSAANPGRETLTLPARLGIDPWLSAAALPNDRTGSMIAYIPWIERSFRNDYPVRAFPNVLERLRGTPGRAEGLVRHVSRETMARRVTEQWSIQEHVGHLIDLGALDRDRLDDFSARREQLTAADMTNRRTREAGHNERRTDELLAQFRRERGELMQRLDELDEEFVGRTARHPRLGVAMKVVDWAHFVAEHDDHHLAVMTGLLRR
jgi:hypothetical protein